MIIVLIAASLLGGVITLAFLWPYGALVAVLSAPFGGSMTALLVGGLIALRGAGYDESFDRNQEQATEEMVALLRACLRRGFPEWLGRDSGGVGLGSGTGIDGETARATGLRDRSDRRAMGAHCATGP